MLAVFQGLISLLCAFRSTLWSDIRMLGRNPSAEVKARVQDRRESLQSRIKAFHQQALQFVRSDVASTIHSSLSKAPEAPIVELGESDEETFFLDTEPEWEDEELMGAPAEQLRLWLPSSFTKAERSLMGLGRLAEVEAELPEGQANDALEALRAGLAEKSLRFRTEVKPAKSQKNNDQGLGLHSQSR